MNDSELIAVSYPYCFVSMAMTVAPDMRKDTLLMYVSTYFRKYEPHLTFVTIKGLKAICREK
ncbi:hypothetical protein C6370_18495 [Bacillus atrophaeus]|nr:hypothetical protein C6370_18495 [Bacillus atrophaeus]